MRVSARSRLRSCGFCNFRARGSAVSVANSWQILSAPCAREPTQRGRVGGPPGILSWPPPLVVGPPSLRGSATALPSVCTTSSQRVGEPAWHRRARRRRGEARALLRIAAARELLSGHHSRQRVPSAAGAAMPNARGKGANGGAGGGGNSGGKGAGGGGTGGGERWSCRICGLGDNFAWRTRCRGCEGYRRRGEGGPLSVSPDPTLSPTERALLQPPRQQQGAAGSSSTLAERQLQRQRDELRAQKRKSEEEVRRLREENVRLAATAEAARAANGGAAQGGGGGAVELDIAEDDMDCAEAYASWTEEERREQLEVARGGLAYAIKRHGETSEEADAVRSEIEALQRASREAKPFRAHRSQLERRRDKLRRQQDRDGEEIARVEATIEEQRAKLEELRAAVADRSKALASVEDELTELVKKALAEEGKTEDESAAWSAEAAANVFRTMAAKPGVPPAMASLLEQVQLAVAAMVAAAAPAQDGQQQQPQQQHQQKRQEAEQGPATTGAVSAVGGSSPTPAAGTATAAVPTFLGPQGRWAAKGNQAAGAAASREGAAGGPPGTAGADGATSAATAAGLRADGAAVAASAPANAPAAPTPAAHVAAESEEELVDDAVGADGHMEVDVESSINKLPMEDQAKLRRALKSRGGIGRGGRADDAVRDRSRERERSPRMARKGGAEEDGQRDI